MPWLTAILFVSTDSDSVQMLQRSTQVGEYYRMAAPKVWDAEAGLPPHYMDIVIYDEEQDKHVHITFAEALRAATHGATNVNTPAAGTGPAGGFFGSATADGFQDKAVKAHGQGKGAVCEDTVVEIIKQVSGTPADPTATTPVLAVKPKWIPAEIIIARPFIEHLMMSAVLAVAGRDTGATLFGPADMQISANTSVKTIEGMQTCHLRTLVLFCSTTLLPQLADTLLLPLLVSSQATTRAQTPFP